MGKEANLDNKGTERNFVAKFSNSPEKARQLYPTKSQNKVTPITNLHRNQLETS
jgi:hypothetical protein